MSTWNGNTRSTLLVMGTTVTTPRPNCAATVLAWSLLTMTAGRRLSASPGRAGARSVSRTSPRRIGEPVGTGRLPVGGVTRGHPLVPGSRIGVLERGVPEPADGALDRGGARSQTLGPGVAVQGGDVLGREADAELHPLMLLGCYHGCYRRPTARLSTG